MKNNFYLLTEDDSAEAYARFQVFLLADVPTYEAALLAAGNYVDEQDISLLAVLTKEQLITARESLLSFRPNPLHQYWAWEDERKVFLPLRDESEHAVGWDDIMLLEAEAEGHSVATLINANEALSLLAQLFNDDPDEEEQETNADP